MSTKKISELNAQTAGNLVTANDVLPIVDIANNETKKITVDVLMSNLGNVSTSGSLTFTTSSVGINLKEEIGATADAATYTIHGKKVTVQNQLQAQIADGAQSAFFTVTNNSVDTNSVVMGNVAGNTALVCGLSQSIMHVLNSADNTFKFAFQNETGVAVPDNTPFTASFVVL